MASSSKRIAIKSLLMKKLTPSVVATVTFDELFNDVWEQIVPIKLRQILFTTKLLKTLASMFSL